MSKFARLLYYENKKYTINTIINYRHEVVKCSHEIRQLKITTSISTTELMSTPLQAMSAESRPAGPSDDAIKQRIRRLKRKIFPTIIPKTREEIIFPDQYTLDLRGFPFLLHDDGQISDRFIIFATQQNLEVIILIC